MGVAPPREEGNDEMRRRISRTMSRIGARDTGIEVRLRKALWRLGIRYRKNYAALPGKPDIAITKHRIAVFCDGDFWHGRAWETKKHDLRANRSFWVEKIERNMGRDIEVGTLLRYMDWIALRFWGGDILKRLEDCTAEVEYLILLRKMEASATDWEFCDL